MTDASTLYVETDNYNVYSDYMRLRIGGNTVLRTGEDHTHNNWQSRSYDVSSYDGYTGLTLGHDASTTGFDNRRASMSYIRLDA